jgi:hypothetical protein
MTPLSKAINRSVGVLHRGRALVVRVAPEGIYTKGARERWSSAYLVPWTALDDLGARLKARRDAEDKKQRRRARRGF